MHCKQFRQVHSILIFEFFYDNFNLIFLKKMSGRKPNLYDVFIKSYHSCKRVILVFFFLIYVIIW